MTTAEKILQENLVARKTEELCLIVDDWKKINYVPLKQQAAKEIFARARELVAAADEGEPQISETSCKCCDKNGEGFARATLRTTAIKRIEFSEDGAAAIRMRNGDPIIFKDISEVIFIS